LCGVVLADFQSETTNAVIPGRDKVANPESRDSGFDASHRPGMTNEEMKTSPAMTS
jgi:DNA helicase-2/ATP-dependent DNA helicase PcrA